jgi:23S rRNA (cytosine1962-C5)-methyltransferase
MSDQARPIIRLQPNRDRRVRNGHPWVYSNEIAMTAEAKALPPGIVAAVQASDGRPIGTGFFNPHSLISLRLLDPDPSRVIDESFLAARLNRALALRQALFAEPFYRLIHAEADGLPGLVIDRFGEVAVVQLNSAGLDRLREALVAALDTVIAPRTIVLRNDSSAREQEGLARGVEIAKGEMSGPLEVRENGLRFLADLSGGQKTGWFFDQRDNRAFMAALAKGRRVLDLYSYSGGFGIAAAAAGATEVMACDRSEPALALAEQAAALNGVAERMRFVRAEAFDHLEKLVGEGARFGMVICDPPAFVRSQKDLQTGARGYRKLARLAATLVEPGGILFVASCSHNMPLERFAEEVARGIGQAGRTGRIIRTAGAAPDHPVHPMLPESAYLKAQVLQLD